MQDAREELYILLEESYVLREKSKDILSIIHIKVTYLV